MTIKALAKRLDVLDAKSPVGYQSPEDVTVDDLMSGECFRKPRGWTLEDLIAPTTESGEL